MTVEKPKTIVIVEDSYTQAVRLKLILKEQNYNVLTANNGEEALAVASENKPDLILSDIVMPGMDGFEMCRILKADPVLQAIPVLLLTTLSESESIIKALEVGADYYVTKPYEKEYMLSRVASIFETLNDGAGDQLDLAYKTAGDKLSIFSSGSKQMIRLLMSTYENAVEQNRILRKTQDELEELNEQLNQKVEERTESLQREVEIRKAAEENYRSIYENSTLGIYRSTPDGLIIMTSPALISLLGYTSFEELMVAANFDKEGFLRKTRKEKFRALIEQDGVVHGFESEWFKADGSVFFARESAKAIRDKNGKTLYYEGTVEDVTMEKRAERDLIAAKEKAEEMNRLKTSFLANMSHELRTPMIGILGFTELLIEDAANEEVRQNAEIINKSGHRLMNTLNLILDLSSIEAGKLKYNASNINIVKIISEEAALFREAAEKKSLYLNVESAYPSMNLMIDERMLRQVVVNLINNGIKYTSKGGVTVRVDKDTRGDKPNAIIKVMDTGIGIAKANQSIIWEEFRQVSEGYNRKFEGPGLGLTITKNFIEKMGGEITLESDIGSGAIFTVYLPIETQN